jgi:hypothetical protein
MPFFLGGAMAPKRVKMTQELEVDLIWRMMTFYLPRGSRT